jgi:hypothetical protein
MLWTIWWWKVISDWLQRIISSAKIKTIVLLCYYLIFNTFFESRNLANIIIVGISSLEIIKFIIEVCKSISIYCPGAMLMKVS